MRGAPASSAWGRRRAAATAFGGPIDCSRRSSLIDTPASARRYAAIVVNLTRTRLLRICSAAEAATLAAVCLKGGLGPGDLLCLAPAWVLAASVIIGALGLAIGLVALARSRRPRERR